MKTLIPFLVFGVTIAGSAQTSLKTFTSKDHVFRFQYSSILRNCRAQQNSDDPASCSLEGPGCSGPGSEGTTLACISYPKERFEDKPRFVAAAFYVSEIQSAKAEDACLKGSPYWYVIHPKKPGTTTINHIAFKTFEIGDNWTNHGESGPAYRTFHDGKCYELGIQT